MNSRNSRRAGAGASHRARRRGAAAPARRRARAGRVTMAAVAAGCAAAPAPARAAAPRARRAAAATAAPPRPAQAAATAATCDPEASSLAPLGPPEVTPGSFMAKIKARGYLIAGVDQSTYHFGYLNPLDGQIEGFDIDMIRAVAQAIFGNPDKVEYKSISDAQRITAITNGSVDIVAHTMTITCDRLSRSTSPASTSTRTSGCWFPTTRPRPAAWPTSAARRCARPRAPTR